MKLICFPHYTCGGLLCDVLNNTFSSVNKNGGLNSVTHNIGKIGVVDSDTVLTDFNPTEFVDAIKKKQTNQWIGTHHWPGYIDTNEFEKIIVVSTHTYKSRLYRWTRAYHHCYIKSAPWTGVVGQQRVDKERETAKNYISAFGAVHKQNVINIEFSEVVEQTVSFNQLVEGCDYARHIERWCELNKFLYNNALWNADSSKRFYEAEMEVLQKQYYIYE
jgi:hypothetical protein